MTDFGLSIFIGPDKNEDINNEKQATHRNPLWSSPEVLQSSHYSKKSDVFSFGIILWELMTFQQPYSIMSFEQDLMYSIYYQIVHNDIRPEIPDDRSQLPGKWDPELEAYINLIRDCWKRDPVDRPLFYEINRRLMMIKMKMYPMEFQETWYGMNPITCYGDPTENVLIVPFPESNDSQCHFLGLDKFFSVKKLLYLIIVLLCVLIVLVGILIFVQYSSDDDGEIGIKDSGDGPLEEYAEYLFLPEDLIDMPEAGGCKISQDEDMRSMRRALDYAELDGIDYDDD